MHPINWKILAFTALAIICGSTGATPFPPPDTLSWHSFKEVHLRFRAPKSWSYRSQPNEDPPGFFISRQIVAGKGKFAPDVSLSVVNFPSIRPREALAYATSFAAAYPQKFGSSAECGWKTDAPLTLFWCQADVEDDGRTVTVLHHLIANSATGKLYIFTFDALREDWEQSWPTITTMLKSIEIDPSY
jgi:hypothetical protein